MVVVEIGEGVQKYRRKEQSKKTTSKTNFGTIVSGKLLVILANLSCIVEISVLALEYDEELSLRN